MGGAIGADSAGTVQGERDIQILQCHIVYELVVAALQESGIDGDHRLLPFAGQPGGEGDGVLRSEEHTSELQSLMRSSYAVFCWQNKQHVHTYMEYIPQWHN